MRHHETKQPDPCHRAHVGGCDLFIAIDRRQQSLGETNPRVATAGRQERRRQAVQGGGSDPELIERKINFKDEGDFPSPELDRMFRKIAWQAVINHPLSGVTDHDGNGIGD